MDEESTRETGREAIAASPMGAGRGGEGVKWVDFSR